MPRPAVTKPPGLLIYKLKRLKRLKEDMESNKSQDQVLSSYKPPIFWKDKELVKQQISNYSKENIKYLLEKITKTELLIKKNYNISINILLDFIINQGNRFLKFQIQNHLKTF